MMAPREACIRCCLAGTLESLGRAELAYDDRSSLKAYARYRVQE